ncbi:MAG: protein kinase, partial [Ktedonobacteraceae bacterium]
ILPVYDFGIEDGLAYLVMPYIRSGTLFDLLNREGTLPLASAACYLEQLAAALHYAHTRGIIHGDVTPSNILLDTDRRVLLGDFALTSITMEKPTSQMRLLRSGIALGSLAYQAPEQIMGESVGPAADIYALGVILFQMLTGQTPFHDPSPISLAAQQVQANAPAPRALRPEIPDAAEQVILRALAKGYTDRYASAQEMSDAFLAALGLSGQLSRGVGLPRPLSVSQPDTLSVSSARPLPENTEAEARSGRAYASTATFPKDSDLLSASLQFPLSAPPPPQPPETPAVLPLRETAQSASSLFAPHWQNVSPSGIEIADPEPAETRPAAPAFALPQSVTPAAIERQTGTVGSSPPAMQTPLLPTRLGLKRKARMLRVEDAATAVGQENSAENPVALAPTAPSRPTTTGAIAPLPVTPLVEESRPSLPSDTPSQELPTTNPGTTGTMKLSAALKIVQVPVAGQPGRYVTGFLPMQANETSDDVDESSEDENSLPETSPARAFAARLKIRTDTLPMRQKIIAAALVALVIIGSCGALIFARGRSGTAPKTATHSTFNVPNVAATFNAQATATAKANYILVDALSQNIHNWPIARNGSQLYYFTDSAYHIFDNASGRSAPAFLPGFTLKEPLVYSLTMDEIKGNDGSINNSFGMILFFSTRNKGGHSDVTFYSFEVVNAKSGQYQFWKYDSSKGSNPWTSLWRHGFGKEYHQGQGAKYANTFAVAVSSSNFTFLVNGHKVGLQHDSSFNSGEIGMLVNLKGTEVAFSHLQLTYHL